MGRWACERAVHLRLASQAPITIPFHCQMRDIPGSAFARGTCLGIETK
jgi:hypothetical protein